MRYVDGYLLPVAKKNLKAYFKMAAKAAVVWRDHGALEYMECAGEDLFLKWGTPFPKLLELKRGETVVFSFIVYKSRKDRDRVNAAVMKDKRLEAMMDPKKKMPFDMGRMCVGGFDAMVDK
jgi:uncharacterized protein YbaA (DUF1428 family)